MHISYPAQRTGALRWSALAARFHWAVSPTGLWGIWVATRAIMLLNLILGHHYCDPQFYQYAGYLSQGKLPFIDYAVEYPPMAMLFILIPAIPLLPFAGIAPRPELDPHPWHPDPVRYQAYGISFGILILLLDACTLLLVMRAARRFNQQDSTGHVSGLIYTLLVFASGAVLQKFELATGTFVLLGILCLVNRRDGLAWAMLACAALIKGYPVLLAPLFLIWMFMQGRFTWQGIRRGIVGGAIVCTLLIVPIVLISGIDPLLHSVRYHTDRGIEIETVWGSIIMVAGWLGITQPISYYNPADLSADIRSSIDSLLMVFNNPLLIGLTCWMTWTVWQRLRLSHLRVPAFTKEADQRISVLAMLLLQGALIGMLIFLFCFKALGLHYLVGIIPLAAVVRLPDGYTQRWFGLLAAGLIVGQLAVTFFPQLIALEVGAQMVMVLRNVLLLAATFVLVRAPMLQLWKEALTHRYYDDRSAIAPPRPEPVPSPI